MKVIQYFSISFLVVLVAQFMNLSAGQVTPCNQIATVIFTQRLKKSNIPAASKAQLQQVLNNLYLGYLVKQNGVEVFGRSGTDPKSIETYWQALKNGTASYDTNPFCLYTALKQNPQDIQDNKICIDTASLQSQPVNVSYCQQNLKNMYEACGAYNLILKDLLNQIDPKNFQSIQGDEGQWQTNYVTYHLQKTIARLSATSSMVCNGMSCTPQFTGDVRDRGTIVNIQNNTSKNFAIVQSTVDGQDAKQIGMLKPGLNNVNLNLASLQAVNATPQTPSAYKLEVVEIGNGLSADEQFSIKIMTGTVLLAFLKSINKNPKGLFFMNGRLIAPKYAVDPQGQYLVLVKLPKNQTAETMAYDKAADQAFPIDQRIQVIALNNSNPYFITMQINEDEVEYEATKDAKEKLKMTILQPSFFSMQSLPGLVEPSEQSQANQTQPKQPTSNNSKQKNTQSLTLTNALPPVILPDFLADNENLNVYTTILQAGYIAFLTDFTFFNQKCFANDMMCYNLLGYFDKKNQRRFVLNFYSLYLTTKDMLEIDEIKESAIFETCVNSYNDIPNLYIALGNNGKLVSNQNDSLYFNLKFSLSDDLELTNNFIITNLFFGQAYAFPFQNDVFIKFLRKELSENIFIHLDDIKLNKYSFSFSNKEDKTFKKYNIYSSINIKQIKINFLNGRSNWIGCKVSSQLINFNAKKTSKFKLNYSHDIAKKQYELHVSAIKPIDKIKVIHTIDFFKYPIIDMYLDLFDKYEISPIYRCILTENGVWPSFLQALDEDDWARGIYMVTEVKDNNKLSVQYTGALTVTFYKLDGTTKLGEIILQGKSETTGKIGITETIHAYNLGSTSFIKQYNIFLSTGILLRYKKNN